MCPNSNNQNDNNIINQEEYEKALKIYNAIELYPINEPNDRYVGVNVYDISADKVKKPVSVYIDYETSKNFIDCC